LRDDTAMTGGRLLATGSLLVAAASCGARTPLDLLVSSSPGDASDGGGGTVGVTDASTARMDATPSPGADASVGDAVVTTDAGTSDTAADVTADVAPPVAITCSDAPGLQPGSPWPIAHRCSARGGNTRAVGPGSSPTGAWQATSDAGWGGDLVIAADGTVYAYDGDIVAFAADGSTKWTAPFPSPTWPVYFAIGADGTLYAWDGVLAAFRPDGTSLWSTSVTASTANFGPAVGPDGTIYVAGIDDVNPSTDTLVGTLTAVSPQGAVLWKQSYGYAEPFSFPAVGTDGNVYLVVATMTGTVLYAFTPGGSVAWTAPLTGLTGGVSGGPVVVGDDGTVYASCSEGVCSFGPDGAPISTFGDGGALQIVLAPAVGLVYESDVSSALTAFTAGGAAAWSYEPPLAEDRQVVLFADGRGTAYLSGTYYDLQPTTTIGADGGVGWTSSTVDPIAMGADGTLYGISSDYKTMMALSP
jgi:outer membrane protein assembly factor BamB